MTSKTTNKFSPEVRARPVRMVQDHEGEHTSLWSAVSSIAAKIGCTAQTVNEWMKKTEHDRRCARRRSRCIKAADAVDRHDLQRYADASQELVTFIP